MAAVTVTGVQELDKELVTLLPRLQKKAIRKATRACAKIVADDAKASAPVVSGNLAKNIKVRALPRSRNSQGHGVAALLAHAGEAFYALFVEFGTKMRRHKSSGKSVGRIEKHHHAFLRPALYSNVSKIKRTFIRVLWQGISDLYKPTRRRLKSV